MIVKVPPRHSNLSRSKVRDPHTQVSSRLKQARYLVAEYLHDWGLRDPEIIAEESRRIVETALRQIGEKPASPQLLYSTAIQITMDEVEAAIARMAASSVSLPSTTRRAAATNNSIVPRIGRVLLEFPDAIRHRDRPPAQLLQVLETSVNPIIPQCNRCVMRPQPQTRLWKLLRRGYWYRARRRLVKLTGRCLGIW